MSEVERTGLPTVFVATTEFVDGAEAQARALGFEHTAVYVRHPIQDRTDSEIVTIADDAVEAIIAGLTDGEHS